MSAFGRVIVTGATGFVGSHLARLLCADGAQVHVIVRPSSSLSPLSDIARDIGVHEHDGTTAGLAAIMGRVKPGIVFHLAAFFRAVHAPEDVEPMIGANVMFGAQVLEAMSASGCGFVINAGTSWQHYGGGDYDPACLYAATKQAFEDIMRFYQSAGLIKAVTLKLFDTYGPRDDRGKLLSLLRAASLEGSALEMSGGAQEIDMVYIDDVCEAFVLAGRGLMEGGIAEGDYAISSGAPISLKELVRVYAEATGRSVDIRWGALPYRPREVMNTWKTGRPLPGWQPRTGLMEGIIKMEQSAEGRE